MPGFFNQQVAETSASIENIYSGSTNFSERFLRFEHIHTANQGLIALEKNFIHFQAGA